MREQYPNKIFHVCLELHTYSSLHAQFIHEYQGTLQVANTAAVFYSPDALTIKGLDAISPKAIKDAFGREDLFVFTKPEEIANHIIELPLDNAVLLLMSSGNYGGLDWHQIEALAQ